jgi:deazaflavin-dependent oxidoreductase (nitroreductase family)
VTRRLGGVLAALLAAAGPVPADTAGTAAAGADVAALLASVRDQREVRLTTTGRRSGKPHTIPVWFMVEGSVVYLNTLDPTRDWVKNAQKNPDVRLDFGATVLAGRLRTVTDEATETRIKQALRDKYWVAWAGGLVGQGPKATFVVDELRPVTP